MHKVACVWYAKVCCRSAAMRVEPANATLMRARPRGAEMSTPAFKRFLTGRPAARAADGARTATRLIASAALFFSAFTSSRARSNRFFAKHCRIAAMWAAPCRSTRGGGAKTCNASRSFLVHSPPGEGNGKGSKLFGHEALSALFADLGSRRQKGEQFDLAYMQPFIVYRWCLSVDCQREVDIVMETVVKSATEGAPKRAAPAED